MFSLLKRVRLPGPSSDLKSDVNPQLPPQVCLNCGGKAFFQQPDFNRAVGLWIVTAACIASCVLFYEGSNWFLTWSPMLVVLIIDRIFMWTSPTAVICYDCEHIYRGLPEDLIKKTYQPFDLDVHDQHQYAKRVQES